MKATTCSALLAGLLLVRPLLADLPGGIERSDRRFVCGLVDRRLFDLAASECERLLADSDLTVRERVEWVVELIRIHSQRAMHAPRLSENRCGRPRMTRPRRFWPRRMPIRAALVLVQDALVWLAQGELAWMEAEVAGEPGEALDRARLTIRRSTRALEEQDTYLTEQISRVADRAPEDGDAVSAAELFALQNHVRFQLSRAAQPGTLLPSRVG